MAHKVFVVIVKLEFLNDVWVLEQPKQDLLRYQSRAELGDFCRERETAHGTSRRRTGAAPHAGSSLRPEEGEPRACGMVAPALPGLIWGKLTAYSLLFCKMGVKTSEWL